MNSLATPFSTPGRELSPVWFVSLSLLLHLILLWAVTPDNFTTMAAVPTPNNRLAVQLVRQSAQQPAIPQPAVPQAAPPKAARERPPQAAPGPPRTSEPAKAAQLIASPKEESTHADENRMLPEESSLSERQNVSQAPDGEARKQRIQIVMQQVLSEHFRYPLLAQRRGWQGEVILAFRLEVDGRILNARIAQSSGYGVLDRAALRALDKVGRLQHNGHHAFTLEVPVIYRLEG